MISRRLSNAPWPLPIAVIAVIAVVAALLLVLLGRGPVLETGRVIEKMYDDPDTWYQPGYTIDGGQTCSGGYGDTARVCVDNPDTHIPGVWHTDPERFLLKLRGPHPKDTDKMLTETVSVPESLWTAVSVGQWVNVKTMEIIER